MEQKERLVPYIPLYCYNNLIYTPIIPLFYYFIFSLFQLFQLFHYVPKSLIIQGFFEWNNTTEKVEQVERSPQALPFWGWNKAHPLTPLLFHLGSVLFHFVPVSFHLAVQKSPGGSDPPRLLFSFSFLTISYSSEYVNRPPQSPQGRPELGDQTAEGYVPHLIGSHATEGENEGEAREQDEGIPQHFHLSASVSPKTSSA